MNNTVLAGEFTILNRQLLDDLIALNLWSPEMKNQVKNKQTNKHE